jgi:arylsulfatase A-like enzyme
MKRRWAVLFVVAGLAALCLWLWRSQVVAPEALHGSGDAALAGDRPSILIYMIDTLRARDVGAYGADVTRTPAMDAFAAESALFENAKTPSSWTRPAVASLITGVSPSVHGVETFHDVLSTCDASQVRLPELLQAEGYFTGAVVANPQVDPIFGFGPGFDSFQGLYEARTDRHRPTVEEMISSAPTVVDAARRFIEEAPTGRPFFLFVLTIDPHGPYDPPPPYDSMYDPRAVGVEVSGPGGFEELRRRMEAGRTSPELLAKYRGEVSFADAAFGDLISWMRERGSLDDTLVVLTADHGEEFAEHGNKGHGKTLYEEVVAVPLILRHPGSFESGRHTENVDLMDLGATLAAVGGARPPDQWTGRDLRGALTPAPVFSTSLLRDGHLYRALTRGTLKLIENEETHTTELYDLRLDPGERRPLDQARYREQATALAIELQGDRERSAILRERMIECEESLDEDEIPGGIRERLESLGYIDRPSAEE